MHGHLNVKFPERIVATKDPTLQLELYTLENAMSTHFVSCIVQLIRLYSLGDRRKDVQSTTKAIYSSKPLHVCMCAGDKIEKNEMGWACGAYG